MKNVVKERDIGIALGSRNDNKFYASSSQTLEKHVINYYLPNASSIYLGGMALAATPRSYPNFMGRERIDYVIGAPDSWNPCVHRRVRAVQLPYLSITQHYKYSDTYYVTPFAKEPFNGSPVTQIESHLVSDYNQARARAWHTMQPRFQSGFSLINFLYELKDVQKMISSFLYTLAKYRKAVARIKQRPGNPITSVADGVLTWNFGIAPLLSDLTEIWANLQQKVSEAQALFQIAGEEPNTYHYSEVLAEESSISYRPKNLYFIADGTRHLTKFFATMEFGYDYKMRNKTDAFMRYWGLAGSWEAFFNMVPFSFILDYFIGISKALHFMSKDKNVTMHVLRYAESLKTVKTSGTHVLNISKGLGLVMIDSSDVNNVSLSGIVSGYESLLYTRAITSPYKGMYIPRAKSITDKQTLNLVCLAVSLF